MALSIEGPLSEYSATIGGSAGKGTHGAKIVSRPKGMPSEGEADHKVTNYEELKEGVEEDGANVLVVENINVTNKPTIHAGDGVTLYSRYCDPNSKTLVGPYIYHEDTYEKGYSRKVIQHRGGEPMQLYGIYALGPRYDYFDPDHESEKFKEITSSFLHEYAGADEGLFKVVGCRFTGWTLAGLEIGAKNYRTEAEVHRSTFERNYMEHLGYGIEHYRGDIWIDRCFFDKCRHGFAGFGYADETVDVTNCLFGPGPWAGHALDMHGLANNTSTDSDVAGQHLRVRNCTFMSTKDVAGYGQEGVAIRGVSKNESRVYKCEFWHPKASDPPGEQGSPIRQESGTNNWKNLKVYNNHYGGRSNNVSIGVPRKEKGRVPPTPKPPKPPKKDKDEQKRTPDMKEPYQTLEVKGTGIAGGYWFHVQGAAKVGKNTEQADSVTIDESNTLIKGSIVGAADTFKLSNDARLKSAWFDTPMEHVTLDGKSVPLAPLIAIEMKRRFKLKEK